ncbi:iron complex transport system substrate-binding protein [Thermocatellispora tengchongensis]|uniref:Iron complex transport system substrate-binding protein n=1 Tax=Thermocatellispora tengchongensis TaxID=1073253 RepID=A0A840P6L1_9ACTN|nr:ABC transporter substrate-binding protein [Thermocatellispora tengchongensis]MBB5134962.1 iron complex transport system substrate-binding protein [Thermocatellispora tengchongensis]
MTISAAPRRAVPLLLGAVALLAATACGQGTGGSAVAAQAPASSAPVEVTNCGATYRFDTPPQRIVTSSTIATEIVLALGARDRLVGTVAPGELLPEVAASIEGVPIIAKSAFPPPSKETVFAADPDFVVSGYNDDYGPKALGDREQLRKEGVNSYLLSGNCPGRKAKVEDTYTDIRELGRVLGAQAKAEELVAKLKAQVEAVRPVAGTPKVFDYAGGLEKPSTAGSNGLIDDLIRRAGGENVFPEVTSYSQISWEELVKRDPDAIVVEDQAFEPADKAIEFLTSYEPIKDVTAIKEKRFIVIPVNDTQPGLRSGRALETLVAGLAR